MRRSIALVGFSRYTDASLEEHAQSILTALTGNANFPVPSPNLSIFTAAITAFQNAMAAAASKNHSELQLKYQSREVLIRLMKRLGTYVDQTANNDAAKILSSGFKIKKHRSHTGPLPKPSAFAVQAIGKGEIKLKCARIKNARTYYWEYKQTAVPNWLKITTTKASTLLTGLESGKEYLFRVVPVGTSDVREYSDTISSFVL